MEETLSEGGRRACGESRVVQSRLPRRVPWRMTRLCPRRLPDGCCCRKSQPLSHSSLLSLLLFSNPDNLSHQLRLLPSCNPPVVSVLHFAMATFRLPPATRPLLRGQLISRPANGHVAFIPQVRKVVFEFCDKWPSSANTRTYIHNHLEELARSNPHVEFVLKQRTQREPIIRGFYSMSSYIWCPRPTDAPPQSMTETRSSL